MAVRATGNGSEPALEARNTPHGAEFSVHVTPRAGRTEIVGVAEGYLRVRLAAAPVEGAANGALVAVLAASLRVPRRDVAIVSGQTSRHKWVRIVGLDISQIRERLGL